MEGSNKSVVLYVYDMTKGLAKSFSTFVLGKQVEGIWHTSIVAFGQEYFFGSGGIDSCLPGGTVLGQPDRTIDLGKTGIPFSLFMEYLCTLGESNFRPEAYDLFNHNCNNFSQEVANFLTGKSIPQEILDLPKEVLTTPLGNTLKSYMHNFDIRVKNTKFQGDRTSDNKCENWGNASSTNENPQYSALDLSESVKHQERVNADKSVKEPEDKKHQLCIDSELQSVLIIYNDVNISEAIKKLIELLPLEAAAEKDSLLCLEIYSSDTNDTLVLEENHLELIGTLLNKERFDTNVHKMTLQILRAMVLSKNLAIICGDRNNFIMKYCLSIESFDIDLQKEILKLFCSFCSQENVTDWLLSGSEWEANGRTHSNSQVSVYITVHCLLSDLPALKMLAVDLLYNLSIKGRLESDAVTELATALLQFLHDELAEETAYKCLSTFYRFLCTSACNDISALSNVLGPDFQKFSNLSERNNRIAKCIQEKLLLTVL